MSAPIRWGVLSAGRFATNRWLPSFRKAPDVVGVAIASRHMEKARDAARDFGFAKAYGSYEELLADPEVEAVYIPLPNGLHAEWAIRAANAGKHVLVEKPAAANAQEAQRMADAADTAGVRLMEAFMFRHHARWKRILEHIRLGDIGRPFLFRGDFCFTLSDPDNVRFDPKLAGGALADVGCYPVNAARLVFAQEPTHAWGIARDRRGTGVDTTFSGGLRFPDADMVFMCSFETAYQQSVSILGTEGTVSVNRPFICRDEPVLLTLTDSHGGTKEERIPLGDQYVDMISHFGACIRDPGHPLAPGERGVASARTLDALRRSAVSGKLEPV